jgi:dUTP pyrophosphatase
MNTDTVYLNYKKLFENSRAPEKNNPDDSGFDVFVHGFRRAFLLDSLGEHEEKARENGEIPGITTMENGRVASVTLNPNERVLVGTGLACTVTSGQRRLYELQARPRSGNSWVKALDIINSPGTVDNPYRGEVLIIIRNGSNRAQTICIGDKIAQLVPAEIPRATLKETKNLDETSRQDKGFGSSGK